MQNMQINTPSLSQQPTLSGHQIDQTQPSPPQANDTVSQVATRCFEIQLSAVSEQGEKRLYSSSPSPHLVESLRSPSTDSCSVTTPPGDPPSLDGVDEAATLLVHLAEDKAPKAKKGATRVYTLEQGTADLMVEAIKTRSAGLLIALAIANVYGGKALSTSLPAFPQIVQQYVSTTGKELCRQGILHHFGNGCEKNPVKAFILFSAGAELGDPICLRFLGICYECGSGVTKDPQKAFQTIMQAFERGDSLSRYILGNYYQRGFGVEKNVVKASEFLLKEAPYPEWDSLAGLADRFLNSPDIEEQIKAYFLFTADANRGNAYSMFHLAKLHLEGSFFQKSMGEAFNWFSKAAEAGYGEAMGYLAGFYLSGLAVDKEPEIGVKWLMKGAAKGYPLAINALACCNYTGNGVTKDIKKTFTLLDSVIVPDSATLCNQAYCYEKGIGVLQNTVFAENLYRQAADSNFPPAKNCLGLLNLFYVSTHPGKANVVQRTRQTAVDFFAQGAEANDAHATYNLAACYRYGIGVVQDVNRSDELFIKASSLERAKPCRWFPGIPQLIFYADSYCTKELISRCLPKSMWAKVSKLSLTPPPQW